MVNKLINLIRKVKIEKGDLSLFLLMKLTPESSRWTIIISAPWVDRANKTHALNYWLSEIRNILNHAELSTISRISFLNTDESFINSFNRSIKTIESQLNLKNTEVGGILIHEAIVLESKRVIEEVTRNPIARNPIFNHTINPIFNHTINPIFNPNFNGYFIYDGENRKVGYLIDANEDVKLIYNLDNTQQGYAVESSQSFYIVFDMSNNWIGYFASDGADGFNYFNLNNEWVGMLK